MVNVFAGSPLDRQNNARAEDKVRDRVDEPLAAALSEEHVAVLTHSLKFVLVETATDLRVVWLRRKTSLGEQLALSGTLPWLALGEEKNESDHRSKKLAVLSTLGDEAELLEHVGALLRDDDVVTDFRHGKLLVKDLRSAAMGAEKVLSHAEAAICAHARSLFEFHRRFRFCGLCGAEMRASHGASRRVCSRNAVGEASKPVPIGDAHELEQNCPGVVFPRTDPVVITAVRHPTEKMLLLARSARFQPNLYSCVAGFMEHGESIEEAVQRETLEETGVAVHSIKYHSSQPWPFPYSLMIGCMATASAAEITIDEKEIEAAAWFSLDELQGAINHSESVALRVPPPGAIAGVLIRDLVEKMRAE
ncbi:Peroxisomal NADH pyrophosphatase NUDT12 [Porphyridium purpureum]|uniref:NAD(+) diphosphatase n=1 Tax=Porphyridium purpureum TaxID=35688 RepID=A0A5J4YTA5_PORPP|nr:Peroxisomal NADH pyrophosphatase NUDT12 [Porphyridium purpureum]|eukprot:POR7023..scf227_4